MSTFDAPKTSDVIRLLAIRETSLSVDEVMAAVADPSAGGVVLFAGTVRDNDAADGETEPKDVVELGYSAHPSAEALLHEVAARVAEAHPVRALAAVHRVGELRIGELAVVVAVAAAHRGEAFVAARDLIDDLKARLPIWKHQRFADGSDEWVGLH